MRSRFGGDDHGSQTFKPAFDVDSYASGSLVRSDIIRIHDFDYAKGGPGGGPGGGGSGSGSTTWVSGTPTTGDNNVEYNIQITFKGTWTDTQIATVKTAANLVSDWITSDIQDVLYKGKIIDDLSLTMEISNIDGVNGILGQAGPTAIRSGSSFDPYLPATGVIQFDLADMDAFSGQFGAIVLHEILHTVGFGSVWSYFNGLVIGGMFMGTSATGVYGNSIPIEQDGGAGTAGSHWDEATFKDELMTGYIGYSDGTTYDSTNELSYMTVASLDDIGYDVMTGLDFKNTFGDPYAVA